MPGPPRKFDWDEAKRLHDAGISYAKLAKRFGVSETAIARAIKPEQRARMDARSREFNRNKKVPCIDCGRLHSPYRPRCMPCSHLARSKTVRPDTLLCYRCGEWKPDEEFPHGKGGTRRDRHSLCRPCQTIEKRERRRRGRVPCANPDCLNLVSPPKEQLAAARRRGKEPTGLCRICAMRKVARERRAA